MAQIEIGQVSEFPDGECRVLAVGEVELGVFRLGKKLVAYKNRCPHYGGPVCQGGIFDQTEELLGADKTTRGLRFSGARNIVCPWHGYEFNIETGCHPGDPSLRLEPVELTIKDSRVYLTLPG